MLCSIALTTYNGEQFVFKQLESLSNQTINEIEIVVCDDCSSDKTCEILKQYAHNEPRMRFYRNDINLGFKKNFEKVIGLCQGDYIALCDQDDIWLPNHIELLLQQMDENVQIVCGNSLLIDEDDREIGMSLSYLDSMDYIPNTCLGIANHIIMNENTFQGAAMLIKKSFFDQALPIPDDVPYHDTWFAALSCMGDGFKYIDTTILKHRRHNNEVTSGKVRHSSFRAFIGSTLVNHSLKDRYSLVQNIIKRNNNLSALELSMLNNFLKLLKRRNTIWGRLANVPYLLCHFKDIYTFDGKHLFT